MYVYLLRDPRTCEVRYVGITSDMKVRLNAHMSELLSNKRKAEWITELRSIGLKPLIEEVERVDPHDGHSMHPRERYWIDYFRDRGAGILNLVGCPRPRSEDDAMTTDEVSKELNLSRPTLYNRIRAGRLTPLPKRNPALDIEPLRFNRSDVLALKDAPPKKQRPSPAPPAREE